MDPITQSRAIDPGRGAFCALTKKGDLLDAPPVKREPKPNRKTKHSAVKHPGKTFQDSQRVEDRARVKEANQRRAAMQAQAQAQAKAQGHG